MSYHELKTWPGFLHAVLDGRKTFEVRKDDRHFRVGDTLCLLGWSEAAGYTGHGALRKVTYKLPGGQFGIESGYCVLGLGPYTGKE